MTNADCGFRSKEAWSIGIEHREKNFKFPPGPAALVGMAFVLVGRASVPV
jgi:hypothetical protein